MEFHFIIQKKEEKMKNIKINETCIQNNKMKTKKQKRN